MMNSIKNQMFLILLLFLSSMAFTATAVAADKPIWTIDHKKLNLPEFGKPVVQPNYKWDPGFHVQFTFDNKILVSFLQYSPQTELTTKDTPEKFDPFFVVLLLSREDGELIRRVEWPVKKLTTLQLIRYGSRIYPLPSGGYVGIIDQCLQVLDSSFNVIYGRVLDIQGRDMMYEIIVPLSGRYFILNLADNGMRRSSEIINSNTFEVIERFDTPRFGIIVDIWGDRLLAVKDDIQQRRYYEKKIGVSQWHDLGLEQGEDANAKYIYNSTIVITDSIGPYFDRKEFWFMLEDGKKSDPVFESRAFSTPSWNTPVIACRRYKASVIRRILDLFGNDWIEAYAPNARKVLLATKKYSPDSISGEMLLDHAISPNGDSIVTMTNKKIEFYNIKPPKDKKRK